MQLLPNKIRCRLSVVDDLPGQSDIYTVNDVDTFTSDVRARGDRPVINDNRSTFAEYLAQNRSARSIDPDQNQFIESMLPIIIKALARNFVEVEKLFQLVGLAYSPNKLEQVSALESRIANVTDSKTRNALQNLLQLV